MHQQSKFLILPMLQSAKGGGIGWAYVGPLRLSKKRAEKSDKKEVPLHDTKLPKLRWVSFQQGKIEGLFFMWISQKQGTKRYY
jgi:hypothetical protein